MNSPLHDLFASNRAWAAEMQRTRPGFFTNLTAQQRPQYMWIGCSDSRVPANEIVGMLPGEIFVHRNIANVVVHSDLNALCELNVIEQVVNVAQSTVLQDAWAAQQDVTLHGWVYGVHDGLVQDLHMTVAGNTALDTLYSEALSGVRLMPRH